MTVEENLAEPTRFDSVSARPNREIISYPAARAERSGLRVRLLPGRSVILLLVTTLLLAGCNAGETIKPGPSYGSAAMGIYWEAIPQVKTVAFSGPERAWLVTEKDGELWRTEDGGSNWNKLSGEVIGGKFMAVSFIDSRHGWAANYEGQVWRTEDGGQTWAFLSHPRGGEHNDNEPFFLPQQMLFVDESRGWLIDAFAVWRTEDGGLSWEVSLSSNDTPEFKTWQPTEIVFINSDVGWVSGTDGSVHSTKDGGKTWRSKAVGWGTTLDSISFVDERTGWLGGTPAGDIYRSDNGGDSWSKQSPRIGGLKYAGIYGVHFLNRSEGWAVGRNWADGGEGYKSAVLHTRDGGQNWQDVSVGETEPFFDRIHFVDARCGWLFSRDNVYRTQDGGQSWQVVLKFTPIKNTECAT
jgi:photosystem II stability/assembly factor-like uncharacterized protein